MESIGEFNEKIFAPVTPPVPPIPPTLLNKA